VRSARDALTSLTGAANGTTASIEPRWKQLARRDRLQRQRRAIPGQQARETILSRRPVEIENTFHDNWITLTPVVSANRSAGCEEDRKEVEG